MCDGRGDNLKLLLCSLDVESVCGGKCDHLKRLCVCSKWRKPRKTSNRRDTNMQMSSADLDTHHLIEGSFTQS